MNLRSFRNAASLRSGSLGAATVFAAVATAAGLIACSKDPSPPVAYVNAGLKPTPGMEDLCPLSDEPIIKVGGVAGTAHDPPTTETDGTGGLSIQCSVVPSGSGFKVRLSAKNGMGHFSVSGTVDSSGGTGLYGQFLNPTMAVGAFQSTSGCTVSFTSLEALNNADVPQGDRIGAGRIYGKIDCPDAQSQTGITTDKGVATCDGYAEFRFEDCATE